MKALTKGDIIGSDGRLDIYAFMRSPEIREHMRKNKRFNCEDKILIIINSMNPYSIKLEALRILSHDNELKIKDKRKVLYLIRYIERVLKEIYEPETGVVFVEKTFGGNAGKKLSDSEEYNEDTWNGWTGWGVSYYGSYQEFCELYKDEYNRNDDKEPLFGHEFDIVKPGLSSEENNPISFSATWFERRLEIYSITVDDAWAITHGFTETIAKYLDWGVNTDRYSLPFKYLSRVKILTPFMKRPFYGILESTMDGNGSWYHFCYSDDKKRDDVDSIYSLDSIDLSYQFLEIGSNLTVFDWVSSADDIAPSEIIRKFENERSHQRTYIADIKEDKGVCLVGKVNSIVRIEKGSRSASEVYVEIQDDTGSIVVPIWASNDDIGWLKNAAKEHICIRVWTIAKTNETGELCGYNTVDVAILDESHLILPEILDL